MEGLAERVPAPAVELTSEDEASFSYSEAENSDASAATTASTHKKRKRRRAPRQATNFLLAQAPPRIGTKKRLLHLRPRLLLQLQKLSPERRPKPWIDVVPTSVISGSLIVPKLARKFPRMFRIKGELGLNDVILVRSEDYDTPASDNSEEDGDEDSLDKRELVAVISPILRMEDQAEIVLGDGSVWMATPIANGSYEFTHVDAQGARKTARWVKKTCKPSQARSQGSSVASTPSPDNADYTFRFSLIDPMTRRHPIMATLTPTALEVLDTYTTISSSSGRYPPSRPFPAEVAGTDEAAQAPASQTIERTVFPVDETTKTLITVTSVWVSLRHGQGWPTATTRANPAAPHVRTISSGERSLSFPPSADQQHAPRLPLMPRRLSVSPVQPLGLGAPTPAPPPPVAPKRTMSMGAAFVQRQREKHAVAAPMLALAPAADDLHIGHNGHTGQMGQHYRTEFREEEHLEPGYLPLQGQGRFLRRLRALKDKLTGKGR